MSLFNEGQKKDKGIMCVRVVAMAMIFICHIANRLSMGAISQLFQVGVQIFLLLSGYLCAMRPPKKIGQWITRRVKRIFFPIWVFVAFCLVYVLFKGNSLLELLFAGFGLYGITKIATFVFLPCLAGLGHLWYITPLILSYCIYLIWIISHKKENKRARWYFLGILFVCQLLLALVQIRIDYIVIFFVGYCIYDLPKEKTKWLIIGGNVLAVGFSILRFLFSQSGELSSTYAYYFYIIPLCYNTLAFALFYDFLWVFSKINFEKCKLLEKIVLHLDEISYEMYIVHYIFIEGVWSAYGLIGNTLLATLVFLLLSWITAEIVHFISKKIEQIGVKRG